VQRFSGAWSDGSTQRSGGRGANRFNSIGGSLSVIVGRSLECAPAGDVSSWKKGREGMTMKVTVGEMMAREAAAR
jgi:hypothetical protein